jgi:hypothetical protein
MTPRAGEIYYLTKDKPYQIITIGVHKETGESMVIYQALFGDYKTYVLSLPKFMEEMHILAFHKQNPDDNSDTDQVKDQINNSDDNSTYLHNEVDGSSGERINELLLRFLDEGSYTRKLEIITTNKKAIDDRLINDMAASLDCTIEDGPMAQRLQELIYCLEQLSRFEVRR